MKAFDFQLNGSLSAVEYGPTPLTKWLTICMK